MSRFFITRMRTLCFVRKLIMRRDLGMRGLSMDYIMIKLKVKRLVGDSLKLIYSYHHSVLIA